MPPWMLAPWLFPFWATGALRAPLSGDVTQDISPFTNLFSPQVALNFAGDPRIEQDVVSEVASYGRQLGVLTEALLAVAGDSDDPAVRRLRAMQADVEAVKARHASDPRAAAEQAMARLRREDPAAFAVLLERLSAEDPDEPPISP